VSRLKLREASIELRLNCSVFACFLVGIIADFSDQKVDDVGLTLFVLRFVL
jgi:hypothetical protein